MCQVYERRSNAARLLVEPSGVLRSSVLLILFLITLTRSMKYPLYPFLNSGTPGSLHKSWQLFFLKLARDFARELSSQRDSYGALFTLKAMILSRLAKKSERSIGDTVSPLSPELQ